MIDDMKNAIRRTPNIRRYTKIAKKLRQSLINAGRIEWVHTDKVDSSGRTYNTIDLFCGCGGITLGFRQANFVPLFGIDSDPGACATFSHNFPEATCACGRIENLNVDTIKHIIRNRQVHVLCAGFPCPGFSIAGVKDPNDPRNYLYKEVVRIAEGLRPWFIMLENVPRLTTLGNYLLAIHNAFSDIGYSLSVLILESAKYGVPQIRPRTIFIGNRFGLKNSYPKPMLSASEYISIEAAIDDLKYVPRDPTINHEWTRHTVKMIERISKVPPGGSLYSSYLDAWKRQYLGVPAMTIKENHGGTHIHHDLNRVLSAREMARLQSFPDSFIFRGTMKRVYFQVGNAVPPRLANHIALALRPSLDKLAGEIEE